MSIIRRDEPVAAIVAHKIDMEKKFYDLLDQGAEMDALGSTDEEMAEWAKDFDAADLKYREALREYDDCDLSKFRGDMS